MSRRPASRSSAPSVSLIELLLILTMAGLLGTSALPGFRPSTARSKETALLFRLVALRSAIERHRLEGVAVDAVLGDPEAPGGTCGHCLPHGLPRNPVSGLSSVREVVDMPAAADDSTGWA